LGLPDEFALKGVRNAVDFIAELRQSSDLSTLPIGRRVVVIGGGMTAVDAAVQAKLLGAEEVTMVYRRGPEAMSASRDEQQWAQTNGVTIRHWLAPVALQSVDGHVNGITLAHQQQVDGRVKPTGEQEVLPADMVLKAIGQRFEESAWASDAGFAMQDGRLAVDDMGKTSVSGVWAGGDCRAGGRDLTVEAVEDGKQAAKSIHFQLSKQAVLAALAE
jgi:glutamate synthase (NADPH/NADH) small chain